MSAIVFLNSQLQDSPHHVSAVVFGEIKAQSSHVVHVHVHGQPLQLILPCRLPLQFCCACFPSDGRTVAFYPTCGVGHLFSKSW